MAITEWSWQASNGTATAEQTIAAYNALIGKDYTEKFSRLVWNDLCAKVREVALAVKGDWYAYGGVSYSSMLMNSAYGELSSGRFNALRQNTHYPTWKWAYDSTSEGYIGRTDFRGVSSYGDFNSDFVYGVYFIELTQRLNQIIRILNGTEPVYSLTAAPRAVFTLLSDSVVLPPVPTVAHGQLTLPISAGLIQLPKADIINRFRIDGPVFRAFAETELGADYEARIYMNLSWGRNLIQLPAASFAEQLSMTDTALAALIALEAEAISAFTQGMVSLNGFIESVPTVSIGASPVMYLDVSTHLLKRSSFPIDPVYWYSVLHPSAVLESKNPRTASGYFSSRSSVSASVTELPPIGISGNGTQSISSSASLEQTDQFKSVRAAWNGNAGYTAELKQTGNLTLINGLNTMRHTITAVPTIKKYVHPAASLPAVLTYTAALEATHEGGWEYPERQETDTIYIPQVRSTFKVDYRKWLQIDYAYFNELSADADIGTSTDGEASASKSCWTYPVRLDYRTVKVFQSLEVTQSETEIEVK